MEPLEDDFLSPAPHGAAPDMPPAGLYRLSALDEYEIADEEPNILNWEVLGTQGFCIGHVADLIVEPRMLKVRYLDVKVVEELETAGRERHLLIPVGAVSLDEEGKRVQLVHVDKDILQRCPEYMGGPINRDYETAIRENLLAHIGPLAGMPEIGDEENETIEEDVSYRDGCFSESGIRRKNAQGRAIQKKS